MVVRIIGKSKASLQKAIRAGRRKTAEGRLRRQGKSEEEIKEALAEPTPTAPRSATASQRAELSKFGTKEASGTAVLTRKSGEKVYYKGGTAVARQTVGTTAIPTSAEVSRKQSLIDKTDSGIMGSISKYEVLESRVPTWTQTMKTAGTKKTVMAFLTPPELRTPQQFAIVDPVGRFAQSAVITGLTLVPIGRGIQWGGRALTWGATKLGIKKATQKTVGTIGTGIIATGSAVAIAPTAKRAIKGEATAEEYGSLAGGTFILGAWTKPIRQRIFTGAKRYFKPSIKPASKVRVDTILAPVIEVQKGRKTAQTFMGISQARGEGIKGIKMRKFMGGQFDEGYGTARGVLLQEGGQLSRFITEGRKASFPSGRIFDIRFGFSQMAGRLKRRIPFATTELWETQFARGALVTGEQGYGTITSLRRPKQKLDYDTFTGGGKTKTKQVTKEKLVQMENLGGQQAQQFARDIRSDITKSRVSKARTKIIKDIKVDTKILGKNLQQTMSAVGLVQLSKQQQKTTSVGLVQLSKERENALTKRLMSTGQTMAEQQRFITGKRLRTPTTTTTSTGLPPPPTVPTRVPFIFPPLMFGFGGGGRGYNWNKRIKGKEVGGRFARSFTANVLGLKAPRKRKIKRKYTGFEIRI
jgi:hypothetical protein